MKDLEALGDTAYWAGQVQFYLPNEGSLEHTKAQLLCCVVRDLEALAEKVDAIQAQTTPPGVEPFYVEV